MFNSTAFIKQFQNITQSYNLSFHDIYIILSNNLLPEKHRRVWEQDKLHRDKVRQTHATHPLRAVAVPEQELHWDYNTPGGILARDWFLTCLLAGLHKAVLKPVSNKKCIIINSEAI